MKEKSSKKKLKLEINSLKNFSFKKLTDEELNKINGGITLSLSVGDTFDIGIYGPQF